MKQACFNDKTRMFQKQQAYLFVFLRIKLFDQIIWSNKNLFINLLRSDKFQLAIAIAFAFAWKQEKS